MVETGDLVLSLDLAKEVSAVRGLVLKYQDHPMDLGDACCVRLAELFSGSVVYTVDKADFSTYRKHGRQPVLAYSRIRTFGLLLLHSRLVFHAVRHGDGDGHGGAFGAFGAARGVNRDEGGKGGHQAIVERDLFDLACQVRVGW